MCLPAVRAHTCQHAGDTSSAHMRTPWQHAQRGNRVAADALPSPPRRDCPTHPAGRAHDLEARRPVLQLRVAPLLGLSLLLSLLPAGVQAGASDQSGGAGLVRRSRLLRGSCTCHAATARPWDNSPALCGVEHAREWGDPLRRGAGAHLDTSLAAPRTMALQVPGTRGGTVRQRVACCCCNLRRVVQRPKRQGADGCSRRGRWLGGPVLRPMLWGSSEVPSLTSTCQG